MKQRNHSNPRFIRKEEEVKSKIMKEIDLEIAIGKDKALDRTGTKMIIEGMDLLKTLAEMMAEIEVGEDLTDVIIVIEVDQGKEVYLPEGITIIIITDKMVLLD